MKMFKNPFSLRVGKTKKKDGILYIVDKMGDKKKWRKANKKEVECHKYLQTKIGINLAEYKKKIYKSPKQAIAVSYSQAKEKYPDCIILNKSSGKTKKQSIQSVKKRSAKRK